MQSCVGCGVTHPARPEDHLPECPYRCLGQPNEKTSQWWGDMTLAVVDSVFCEECEKMETFRVRLDPCGYLVLHREEDGRIVVLRELPDVYGEIGAEPKTATAAGILHSCPACGAAEGSHHATCPILARLRDEP